MSRPESWEELIERYGRPWLSQREALVFEEHRMTLWRASILEEKLSVEPATLPIRRIYCNRDLVPVLDRAFTLLHEGGLVSEIRTFDGCWNIRPIRGSVDRWSVHSYGLAIDLNAAMNPMGGQVRWSPAFVARMKEAGFIWGGDFKRVDGMHFQWAEGC